MTTVLQCKLQTLPRAFFPRCFMEAKKRGQPREKYDFITKVGIVIKTGKLYEPAKNKTRHYKNPHLIKKKEKSMM